MHKILFLLVVTPIYLISLLPARVHYFFSSVITFFLFEILGYRRNVIVVNIARSFPRLRYNEIKSIAVKFRSNFSEIIAENIKSISRSPENFHKIARIENPSLLAGFHEAGVPVLIVGGHMGNWELTTRMTSFQGGESIGYKSQQLHIVYKQQHSRLSDDIIRWTRTKNSGVQLLESGSAARTMLKNKEDPGCYFLFSDQAPKPGSKFRVRFLNQETMMINGPEIISKAAGIPVIYMEMLREKRGSYLIRFHEITSNPKGCDPGFITNEFARLLEETIVGNPDNWLWSHKRWKRGAEENSQLRKNS